MSAMGRKSGTRSPRGMPGGQSSLGKSTSRPVSLACSKCGRSSSALICTARAMARTGTPSSARRIATSAGRSAAITDSKASPGKGQASIGNVELDHLVGGLAQDVEGELLRLLARHREPVHRLAEVDHDVPGRIDGDGDAQLALIIEALGQRLNGWFHRINTIPIY